ncbi:MAG: hypothetical protein AAGB24_04710 [Bacteroidota bacterium]
MKTIKHVLIFFLGIGFMACSSDDSNPEPDNEPLAVEDDTPEVTCDDGIQNGDETGVDCGGSCLPCDTTSFAVFAITNTEDGSGFLVPYDDLPTGEVDISASLENGYQLASTRFSGLSYGNAVYAPANTFGEAGVQKFVVNASGALEDAGFLPGGAASVGSGTIYGIASPSKGYYSNHEVNPMAVQIFDTNSMTRTGEVDCSAAMNQIVANMDPADSDRIVQMAVGGGFMLERDGKLFTQMFFEDENFEEVVDKTFVAVIDVASDTLEKVIEWPDFIRAGYYSCINCNYASVGDDNHIYLSNWIGNFTDPEGLVFRTIRIKSGETDFDTEWDINGSRDFPNGENFFLGGTVANGKMYVKMFNDPVDPTFSQLGEKKYAAYEIDLATKTPRELTDIPIGYWRSIHGPEIYDDKVYFIVENSEQDDPNDPNTGKYYYYSYDPNTGGSELAITFTGGQPQRIVEMQN